MVVNYLNFVFLNEVKTNSKYWILIFFFQYNKNTKRHFGYMDFRVPKVPSRVFDKMKNGIQIFILRFCFYFNMRNEIEIMTTILIINRFLLWILMTSFVFHFHKKMENEIRLIFHFSFSRRNWKTNYLKGSRLTLWLFSQVWSTGYLRTSSCQVPWNFLPCNDHADT